MVLASTTYSGVRNTSPVRCLTPVLFMISSANELPSISLPKWMPSMRGR